MNPMNLEKILKQLNKIEPDPGYARDLRARLMMAAQPLPKMTFRVFVVSILHSRPAMAAMGLLLVFAIGGFAWNFAISPIARLAKWDAQTLLAEAQAIDTQIHLAALQFSDPGYERQRLISPDTDFRSITIFPDIEEDAQPEPASDSDTDADTDVASSTNPDADTDGDGNASSTPDQTDGDGQSAASTPAEPEDTTVDVEEALDILSN